jgi:predicted DNA-binding transcriptional regulator YafY
VARNLEVIRQWEVLRSIEGSRLGETIETLASERGVSTRTIRRDLAALTEAGFPLFDERVDGRTRWKLNHQPFKTLHESGFTLSEACALYFSRSLVECFAGTPFREDLQRAFAKFESALGESMRRFIDRLPGLLTVKTEPSRRGTGMRQAETIARLLEATLHHRRASMGYHSFSSGQVREYRIEPARLVYGRGGLYLLAFVPAYKAMRTFAVERIQTLTLLEETFEPRLPFDGDAFPHSLGINDGPPEPVEIWFTPRVARYIRERVWHASQKLTDHTDGSVTLGLHVCCDWTLKSWVLGFGADARVVTPPSFAEEVLAQIEEARRLYDATADQFASPGDRDRQPDLPFAD